MLPGPLPSGFGAGITLTLIGTVVLHSDTSRGSGGKPGDERFILSGAGRGGMRLQPAVQDGMQLKTLLLFL